MTEMLAIKELLGRLDQVRQSGPSQWSARCPAHDDRSPSLSIGVGDGGAVLLHCHAGCSFEQVTEALGVAPGDLGSIHARGVDGLPSGSPVVGKSGRVYSDRESASKAAADLVRRQPGHSEWRVAKAYEYVGRDQHPTLVVLRFEPPQGGDKTFRPIHLTDLGWRLGLPQGRLPLYRWQDLPATGTVYVVEGEGVADCAWGLGLPAVTSQGGARAAARSDWSVLRGRDVVILPDNDAAGAAFGEAISQELRRGVSSDCVSVVLLPELPAGGDLVDFVAARRVSGVVDCVITDEIMRYVQRARSAEPRVEGLLTPKSFPLDALDANSVSFVSAVSEAMGCDPAMVALPWLAAAASAIGNSRVLRIKETWVEPPILWVAVVADSGSMKSPALDYALDPLRQIEDLLGDEDREAHDGPEAPVEARAQSDLVGPAEVLRDPCLNGRVRPRIYRHRSRRLLIGDATIEAVIEQLAGNHRGLLLVRDELGSWFEGLRRYSRGPIGDAAKWMELFRAGRITVDRKTGPKRRIDVPRGALCIAGTIQPFTLRRVMQGQHEEDGLAARFMYAMPPARRKVWTDEDLEPSCRAAAFNMMRRLVELVPERESDHSITPMPVEFTREAKARWVEFYNAVNARHADATGLLSAMLAKLEAYVARIALVLHCLRVGAEEVSPASAAYVDPVTLERAIRIGDWAEQEARRVVALLTTTEQAIALRKRWETIQRRGGATTVREWQRQRSIAASADARIELQALVDAGLATWEGHERGGVGRRTERLLLQEGGSL